MQPRLLCNSVFENSLLTIRSNTVFKVGNWTSEWISDFLIRRIFSLPSLAKFIDGSSHRSDWGNLNTVPKHGANEYWFNSAFFVSIIVARNREMLGRFALFAGTVLIMYALMMVLVSAANSLKLRIGGLKQGQWWEPNAAMFNPGGCSQDTWLSNW